jgi:hypothetical protein
LGLSGISCTGPRGLGYFPGMLLLEGAGELEVRAVHNVLVRDKRTFLN